MAAYEVLLLNTAIPQIQAAQSGDTYVVPRDIAFSTVANLANGTNLLPSLTFSSDTNTGIYREGADALGFTAGGGTNQMVLTSTGLGIGTNNPAALLDVSSGGVTSYASPAARFLRNHGAQSYSNLDGLQIYWNTSNGSGESEIVYGSLSTSYLRFIQNNAGTFTTRMLLDSSGNLGLGVTPSAWGSAYKALQVGYAALSNPTATYDTLNLTANLWHDGTNWRFIETQQANRFSTIDGIWTWEYATGSAGAIAGLSTQMTLDASGNLGVGNTTVNRRLEVSDAGNNYQMRIGAGTNSATQTYDIGRNSSDGLLYFYGNQSNANGYVFSGANGERARITSGGNFLVGTDNSAENAGLGMKVLNTGGTVALVSAASDSSQQGFEMYSTTAAAYRLYINYAGTINATSTTISAISDQRLKENIQDLDVGLDKIMALKPRKFDWKTGKGKDIKGDRGWIAQEFEQVFPDLIDEWRDPAPEGEEPYKSVRADLIPVLVKAIQEQQAMINELKAEVAALKGA